MIDEAAIEKTIHRAIMRTWHTGFNKRDNAKDVSIVAAADVMALIRQYIQDEKDK